MQQFYAILDKLSDSSKISFRELIGGQRLSQAPEMILKAQAEEAEEESTPTRESKVGSIGEAWDRRAKCEQPSSLPPFSPLSLSLSASRACILICASNNLVPMFVNGDIE
jgi:hypothetical protein